LLPSLPGAWPTGSVSGLRARGGFEVDMRWKNNALTSATIRNVNGIGGKIHYGEQAVDLDLKPGETVRLDGRLRREK